jgi:hypothetical protein
MQLLHVLGRDTHSKLLEEALEKAAVSDDGDARLGSLGEPGEKFDAALLALLVILLVSVPGHVLLVRYLAEIHLWKLPLANAQRSAAVCRAARDALTAHLGGKKLDRCSVVPDSPHGELGRLQGPLEGRHHAQLPVQVVLHLLFGKTRGG